MNPTVGFLPPPVFFAIPPRASAISPTTVTLIKSTAPLRTVNTFATLSHNDNCERNAYAIQYSITINGEKSNANALTSDM